jgi:hypothetical protein
MSRKPPMDDLLGIALAVLLSSALVWLGAQAVKAVFGSPPPRHLSGSHPYKKANERGGACENTAFISEPDTARTNPRRSKCGPDGGAGQDARRVGRRGSIAGATPLTFGRVADGIAARSGASGLWKSMPRREIRRARNSL